MEPGSISAQRGTLEDPEVLQNVPGHLIPILEQEFDDFKTEAGKFLAGDMPEDEFIKFRLKQGVYGQRQPDVQMIRVKLPFGGITPEQLESFANVIEKYVPLNKGHITTRQNIQMHHIPLPEVENAIRELSESGLSSREGCGNTVRNVTGDPWAGVAADELFDMTPYVGAYVRYFVRHPTTQAMPRKIKTAFDGSEQGRAISEIHDIAYRARVKQIDGRGEVRGAQMLVGGGTSIMPRVAPALYEFVELDNGDYLKIAEAVFRIFDRQDWLRVNRARARIKVFVDKFGIEELRRQVEEELEGDWVAERDFSVEHRLFVDDERESAPAPRAELHEPERRQLGVRALPRGERGPAEAGGLRDGRGQDHARRPGPGAAPWPGADRARLRGRLRAHDGAAEPAAALGAPRERVRRVARAGRAGPGGRGHARDHRRGVVPGHRLVQARDHELDGPEPGGPGARAGDGHHRPADARHPHQDERLPERLRPAPRRRHRLLRRVDQSRRAHDPGVHPARGRRLRRRAGGVRHSG